MKFYYYYKNTTIFKYKILSYFINESRAHTPTAILATEKFSVMFSKCNIARFQVNKLV